MKIRILVTLVLLIGLAALLNPKFNRQLHRWGKIQYYTQITQEGVKVPEASGQSIVTYTYTLPAFDANGVERRLTFTAIKLLRQQAYLRLYAKDDGAVTAWEEVQSPELPEKVQGRLQ